MNLKQYLFKTIFIVLILMHTIRCKQPSIIQESLSFDLNSNISYSKFSPDIVVTNTSSGIKNFEWYIDNDFVSNSFELSSELLKNKSRNVRHYIKLVGISENGKSYKFNDSFMISDTFTFNFVCFKNVTSNFRDNIIPVDSVNKMAVSVVQKHINYFSFVHNPPFQVNILPPVWSKSNFIKNENIFTNRNLLGTKGLFYVREGFYIDVLNLLDSRLQVVFLDQVGRPVGLDYNAGINIDPKQHKLYLTGTDFVVVLM